MSIPSITTVFFRNSLLLTILLSLVFWVGCRKATDEAGNAKAQASFDVAIGKIKNEDWEGALDEFETVLNSGTINADQMGELYAYQALAFSHLGKTEEANRALENARQGADIDLLNQVEAEIKSH